MLDSTHSMQALLHLASVSHYYHFCLYLEKLWSSNITLTTHLADASTTRCCRAWSSRDALMKKSLVSHRFELLEIIEATTPSGMPHENTR